MNRVKIIFELAQYVHPDCYHAILNWRTERLEDLLNYYKEEERASNTIKITVTMEVPKTRTGTPSGIIIHTLNTRRKANGLL